MCHGDIDRFAIAVTNRLTNPYPGTVAMVPVAEDGVNVPPPEPEPKLWAMFKPRTGNRGPTGPGRPA